MPPRQAGADRKTVAQRLRQRDDIERDARMLVAEPGAGPAHAGLDFVDHQQPVVLVAQDTQSAQVIGCEPGSAWNARC